MFDIEFIRDEPEAHEDGSPALHGRITLGEAADEFLASLTLWPRSEYERQWLEAARRLLDGHDRTAFVTSAVQFWWPMWRAGEEVIAQEQLLVDGEPWLASASVVPYDSIAERRSESEDGARVSEWRVPLAELRAFVERRAAQYVPA